MPDRYCGNCGRKLASNSGYCPRCGLTSRRTVGPLARDEDTPRTAGNQRGPVRVERRGPGVALPLAIYACVLAFCAWALIRFGPGFLEWLLDG